LTVTLPEAKEVVKDFKGRSPRRSFWIRRSITASSRGQDASRVILTSSDIMVSGYYFYKFI
jgi:hypothetical protein